MIFLDADDGALQRRFSETRRPHPLVAKSTTVLKSIQEERSQLETIQKLADLCIDTSKLNVHELRRIINGKFQDAKEENKILVNVKQLRIQKWRPLG